MRVAIVGCGFVADDYIKNFASYPEMELVGVADRDKKQSERCSLYHRVPSYGSLKDLLKNSAADIVLNLTSPASHFAVTKACLEAGKHVYSEKPMALEMAKAVELVELAERKGLYLSSAPCSLLGETAQTLWKALRKSRIGRVRVADVKLDDWSAYRVNSRRIRSDSGARWPYKDKFKVGYIMEHAPYPISWLAAFFGPVMSVEASSSMAAITFSSGVVARLIRGTSAAPKNSLRLTGDKGVFRVPDIWDYRSPVVWDPATNGRVGKGTAIPLLKTGEARRIRHPYGNRDGMDFLCGPAELAAAIRERRACRLSARFSLHVNEVVLAIEDVMKNGARRVMRTTFEPVDPMRLRPAH